MHVQKMKINPQKSCIHVYVCPIYIHKRNKGSLEEKNLYICVCTVYKKKNADFLRGDYILAYKTRS